MRTHRPIYGKGLVMEFYVKKSVTHYKIKLWNKNGLNQSLLEEGILEGDAMQVFKEAQQKFTSVEVEK